MIPPPTLILPLPFFIPIPTPIPLLVPVPSNKYYGGNIPTTKKEIHPECSPTGTIEGNQSQNQAQSRPPSAANVMFGSDIGNRTWDLQVESMSDCSSNNDQNEIILDEQRRRRRALIIDKPSHTER